MTAPITDADVVAAARADVALCEAGEPELEAHRVNRLTGHDTGCCSFCGAGGRDTLVAAVPEAVFEAPPPRYLESRRGYADRGGAIAQRVNSARRAA